MLRNLESTVVQAQFLVRFVSFLFPFRVLITCPHECGNIIFCFVFGNFWYWGNIIGEKLWSRVQLISKTLWTCTINRLPSLKISRGRMLMATSVFANSTALIQRYLLAKTTTWIRQQLNWLGTHVYILVKVRELSF